MWRLCTILTLLFSLSSLGPIVCSEYNLFGSPGQGYIVQVNLGHPPQKFFVLIDTGSSTLAIAGNAHPDVNIYFHPRNSGSLYDTGESVHAKYTDSEWAARIVRDEVQFPTVPMSQEVISDIALIMTSNNFYMYGSGWQGILGLAYPSVAARSVKYTTGTWLNAVDKAKGMTMSFSLKMCGLHSETNATHYGSFKLLEDATQTNNKNRRFRTPIIKRHWYEIGVLSVRVIHPKNESKNVTIPNNIEKDNATVEDVIDEDISKNNCRSLNREKSILDSGTTNIRLPENVYRQVVDELREAARASNTLIVDKFWYQGEAGCWPEPPVWSLPWLAIDLLDDDNDKQYFTLELPPKSYMRLVSSHGGGGGSVSELCYKLGLEVGSSTVLGVAAFEGLEITFNRKSGWIGFQKSNCGPDVRITGPYNTTHSIFDLCKLSKPYKGGQEQTIKVAQWTVAVALTIAMSLLLYIFAPCVRARCMTSLRQVPLQISLSRAVLVNQEST